MIRDLQSKAVQTRRGFCWCLISLQPHIWTDPPKSTLFNTISSSKKVRVENWQPDRLSVLWLVAWYILDSLCKYAAPKGQD